MAQPSTPNRFGRLYEDVFSIISAGDIRPGDRIGIKDLSIRLDVSTTPLREIMSRLAGRGVLEERRAEGFYLARLDARDVADLYAFHGACVLQAHRRANSRWTADADAASPWMLFASIANRAGDIAIIEARSLIDDRLRVARRIEGRLLVDAAAEFETLRALAVQADAKPFATAVRRFHDRRRSISADIAAALQRGQVG